MISRRAVVALALIAFAQAAAAEPAHGALEGEARPRRRLEEERGHHPAGEQRARHLLELVRGVEKKKQLVPPEIPDGEDVPSCEVPGRDHRGKRVTARARFA